MDKNSFGKGAGVGSTVALIIFIMCALFDKGAIP